MTITTPKSQMSAAPDEKDLAYRIEIDGLRSFAVLAVIANHYYASLLPLGYFGVDVFFVISGFVIASALVGRTDESLGAFLAGFYARRVKRLLPALVLCVVVTALLTALFVPAPGGYLKTGLFALFGLSNLWLFLQSSDYFADSTALNPFTHTWSLGVEEQFYFVFPLLVWAGARLLGMRGVGWVVAGLSAVSTLAWGWTEESEPITAFYLPVFRFWEIGLGAGLFLLGVSAGGRVLCHAGTIKALCLAGLIALMAGFVPVGRQLALMLIVVLSGALVVLTAPEAAPSWVLRSRVAMYLGRLSYSLYLWHWPVMVLFAWTIGFTGVTVWLALGLALGLAHLSYKFIEQPLRHASWGRVPWRECLVGLGLTGVASVVVAAIGKAPDDVLYLGRPLMLEAVGVRSLTDRYVSDAGAVWVGDACVLSSNSQVGHIIKAEDCVVGRALENADHRILVIGNSFSAAFVQAFDGLEEAAPELGAVSAIVTSSWGASLAPGLPNNGQWDEANAYYWAEVVPALVEVLSPGDQVMIISDIDSFSPELTATLVETHTAALRRDAAEEALSALSETLATRGIGLSVLGPLPFARDANCSPEQAQPQWFRPGLPTCYFLTRDETRTRMAEMHRMLYRLEADGSLRVLDFFNYFCDSKVCDYVDTNDQLLYRDVWSHPSVEAARAVRPLLAQHLQEP